MSGVPPSLKVTVPAKGGGETVAVSVTAWFGVAGLGVLGFAGPLLAYGDPWLTVAAPVAAVRAVRGRAAFAGGGQRVAS